MSSSGKPNNRHVSFHETTRQPPPHHHHQYQPPRMRIPPSPLNYRYYEGPPPRWYQREDPAYYPPYDMQPRDQSSPRPYMPPMHAEDPRRDSRQVPRYEPRKIPLPPQEYIAERGGAHPRIRFSFSDYGPPSPKRIKRYPPGPPPPPTQHPEAAAGTTGITNKPGALSLLAKVAMRNNDSSTQLNHQAGSEYASPVRRMPPSPQSAQSPRPIIWTPPDAGYRYHAPWARGEWIEQPPPYPRRDYPPPTWTYEGPQTPPALVERPSFAEEYYSPEGHYAQYDYPPPPSSDYRRFPPPPDASHQYITPTASRDMEQAEEAYHTAPYTYVQQPRLKEETVLRKKFSWKNYPELEQFLIASRDEYLRHSALNYTAEQKQYNNWLTERLMDVAARHNYLFDPEEFNFVAIRDRIRCYYKSYVQTARKRGHTIKKKQQTETRPTPETTQTTTSPTPGKTQTTTSTEPSTTRTTTSPTPGATEKDIAKTEEGDTFSTTTTKDSGRNP